MTADIEFLVVLTKAILQLCLLSGGAILTVLLVVVIFSLFGGIEMNVIDSVPPERREAILQRAEHLIREDRARRFAPVTNQNAAAPRSVLGSFMGRVLIGCVLGAIIGFLLGAAFPQGLR